MTGPTFILDGSNLAWLGPGDGPALAPVDAIADALRAEWPGCKVITLCDASLRHRLDAGDKAEHRRRTTDGSLVEAPADEDADAYILDAARRLGGCVVTRDLYRDRREARAGIPMLRPALIGGAVILGDPKVFETADDDRGAPLDPAVLGTRVPPPPLPGEPVDAAAIARDAEADDETPAETPAEVEPEAPKPAAKKPRRRKKAPVKAPEEPEADAADDEKPSVEAPATKRKTTAKRKAARKPAAKRKSTRKPAAKRKPKRKSPARAKPTAPPPDRKTALGAFILLAIAAAIGGGAWWMLAEPPEPVAETDPGVLFTRGCRAWQLRGGVEEIVHHPREGTCTAAVAALGEGRLAVVMVDGDTHTTTGGVRLIVAVDNRETSSVELTTGREAVDDRPEERATATIAGIDPTTGHIALAVYADAEKPPRWILRAIDGELVTHTEQAVGVALSPGRAAVLRSRCTAGCGTVHIEPSLTDAITAAAAPAKGRPTTGRWAGPAAFSPDGERLAIAKAFDGLRGGVVIVREDGSELTLPFKVRRAGRATGLAWTAEGLYMTVSNALYVIDPEGSEGWRPVATAARGVSPAR